MGKLPNIESEEIKSLSRQIIGKILSSDLLKFIDKTTYKEMNDLLISQRPDSSFVIKFSGADNESWSYLTRFATMAIMWDTLTSEGITEDGDLLTTFVLQQSISIFSVEKPYGEISNDKIKRLREFTTSLEAVIEDIDKLVPSQITLKTLSKEERIARDEKVALDKAIAEFTRVITNRRRTLRIGLRCGGNSRNVPFELISNIKEGSYEIVINDGGKYMQNHKHYMLVVPKSNIRGGSLRRIS